MFNLLVTSALALGSIQVEVETLDGQTISGALAEWTAAVVVVATDDGARDVPVRRLLAVRPLSSPMTFDTTADILKALGFHRELVYEKYRETFTLGSTKI